MAELRHLPSLHVQAKLVVAAVAMILGTVWYSAGTAWAQTLCNNQHATIVGTNGPDRVHGTPGHDVIQALGGNDAVYGLEGNDLIRGGGGADLLVGHAGRGKLVGG